MADTLTRAQELAVDRPGGPILVAAAAGSGKTKVIVERLMRQILRKDRECSINDYLIITFTKKAAAELRARIAKELAARLAEDPENRHLQKQQSRIYLTQISTVHAFCADLLREFSYELDLPADFRMLETSEDEEMKAQIADDLLEDCYASIESDGNLKKLVDGLGAGRDDRKIPELLLKVYQTAQCSLDPESWLRDCETMLDLRELRGAEQTVWGAYLIQGLRECALRYAEALEELRQELDQNDTLQKYGPLYGQNAANLRKLAACESWDELCAAIPEAADFGRLPTVRNCDDLDLQTRAKAVRKQTTEQIRNWCAEFYGSSQEVLADLNDNASMLRALFDLTREFTRRFDAEKRRLHALDFGDLEHYALRLLLEPDGKTPTAFARRISERYQEIMVDEYQDTNQVQDAIFRAVSREGSNRFMVGDVKQSIYRFRLADPEIFLQKYNSYPDAEAAQPAERQRILLSHNFRSGEAVLEAVNSVFHLCMSKEAGGLDYGEAEALRPGRSMTPLPQTQVELHCLSTRQEDEDLETPEKNRAEAQFVANRIRKMLDSSAPVRSENGTRPVRPGDIVILLRSPQNTAGFYLEALQRQGIPAASDAGESILDASEVQTLICLLQVLDNAHQDIPLTGALLSPVLGVEASALARARSQGKKRDLWEDIISSEEASLIRAVQIITELREDAQTLPLYSLLERVQQRVGLEAVYGVMDGGKARIRNLRAFYAMAASWSEGGVKSLHQFLKHIEELQEREGLSLQKPQSDAVTVMSVHKSKGLEFPVVYLCGLTRRFNQEDMKTPVQFHSRLGAGCAVYDPDTHTRFNSIAKAAISRQTRADNLSEELRILYVAMTRARDLLIMTCCGDSLEKHLTDLSLCLTKRTASLTAAQVSCPADWILMTALLRTEAGALHAVAGKPGDCEVSELPWRIEWHDLTAEPAVPPVQAEQEAVIRHLDIAELTEQLHFRYPHAAAQNLPAKLTATQLKGRQLDREADDGAPREDYVHLKLRKPSLLDAERPLTPAQKGVAVHQAMQFLDFNRTESLEQIRQQLTEMEREAFLTPAQAAAVAPEKLLQVFRGPLGVMLREADQVLREFKFSILTDAGDYEAAAAGEQIMLQGVTDCCLFRNGEITVVDFKTDRVMPGREAEAAARYRPQLDAYAGALARIFQMPVTKRLLYFFATDCLTEL